MTLTYQQAAQVPFEVDNLRLTIEATSSKGLRLKVASFGDGYNQTQIDGLNNQLERWSCRTAPMSPNETWGLESFILRTQGSPFLWTPPDAIKAFKAKIASGKLVLGYKDLAAVALDGYVSPTNYTVNLATGVITSVTIPNDTVVSVTATLAKRYYQPASEWTTTELGNGRYIISFELKRVYI